MTILDTDTAQVSPTTGPAGVAPLTITPACAARVKALTVKEADPKPMLRVMVEGGGCSGFQYRFDLDRVTTADDRVFEAHGAHVVVDEASLELLAGSVVDYTEDLMASAFTIRNPNATATCGCGTSFAI